MSFGSRSCSISVAVHSLLSNIETFSKSMELFWDFLFKDIISAWHRNCMTLLSSVRHAETGWDKTRTRRIQNIIRDKENCRWRTWNISGHFIYRLCRKSENNGPDYLQEMLEKVKLISISGRPVSPEVAFYKNLYRRFVAVTLACTPFSVFWTSKRNIPFCTWEGLAVVCAPFCLLLFLLYHYNTIENMHFSYWC